MPSISSILAEIQIKSYCEYTIDQLHVAKESVQKRRAEFVESRLEAVRVGIDYSPEHTYNLRKSTLTTELSIIMKCINSHWTISKVREFLGSICMDDYLKGSGALYKSGMLDALHEFFKRHKRVPEYSRDEVGDWLVKDLKENKFKTPDPALGEFTRCRLNIQHKHSTPYVVRKIEVQYNDDRDKRVKYCMFEGMDDFYRVDSTTGEFS